MLSIDLPVLNFSLIVPMMVQYTRDKIGCERPSKECSLTLASDYLVATCKREQLNYPDHPSTPALLLQYGLASLECRLNQ